MSDQDPVIRKLAGFTPAADGIDRDEWLFRAGRASVRPPRGWKCACGVLFATQATTLGLWFARPAEVVTVPVAVAPVQSPAPPAPEEPPPPTPLPDASPEAPDRWSYIALVRGFDATGDMPFPSASQEDRHRPPAAITAGSRPTLTD